VGRDNAGDAARPERLEGANASFRVITTVVSSGVSTEATLSWPVRERTATSGFITVSQVNWTSREVKD
jgi:hypothetical protein